jgi:DNA-binding MarR family transcriptional regulator
MKLSEGRTEAWQQLLFAHGRVVGRIDTDLVESCDMSLAEFEVLHHLGAAPDGRLRMNELADRARLSPSGLTRRFDTLVRRGWVTRERCDDDRRGVNAVLTAEGRDHLERARPVHDCGVQEYFFDHLRPEDVECLGTVMAAVADANAPQSLQRA